MAISINTKYFSSFTCELKIIEAKNIKSLQRGKLFVRYYLPSGNDHKQQSIGLETREIAAKNDHVWNESVSLECRGGIGDSMGIKKLRQSMVFELRLRNLVPLVGATFGGSKLLGRAEISLEEILNSPTGVFDKWITMISTRGGLGESPKLKVEIKTRITLEMKRSDVENNRRELCGCKDGQDHSRHGCFCDDFDVFALGVLI